MKKVEQKSFKGGQGTYIVEIDAKKSVALDAVKEAVSNFELVSADVTVAGEVQKGDKGLTFCAVSGAKYKLANREKKDDEKEAPDVLAKIEGFLKDGKKQIKVTGRLEEEEEKGGMEGGEAKKVEVIRLDSAEVVKKGNK